MPLGIDIGRSRIRVASVELDENGTPRLIAVAVRGTDGELGATIRDAVDELKTLERTCVFGLDEPSALLRTATFPKMRRTERERAALFEAARFIDYPIGEALVRIDELDARSGEYAVGIVRKDVVANLSAAARRAKLRTIAIDTNGFALRRALPTHNAILDVGTRASILHMFGRRIPLARTFVTGGTAFTQAIAESLGIDMENAEHRKLAHGLAGAGDLLRDALIEGIASSLVDLRASGSGDISEIALVGNGARLAGFADVVERATGVSTRLAAFAPEVSRTLPADVLRAAAPDWAIAFGLALWSAA
ncbi:MAG: hypothetical protein NVS3B28_13380 [Candidatus Velthaea sp.]